MKERKANYDFLRLLASIGVITNHVSDIYINDQNISYRLLIFLLEAFGMFAVPSFFMLSGAFTLCKEDVDYKLFYKKTLQKIGSPIVIFSVFYLLFHYIQRAGFTFSINVFKELFVMQLMGWYGHPLWYMYTFFGMYLLIPFFIKIKNIFIGKEKEYHILALFFSIWFLISSYFEMPHITWSIGKIMGYMGFVIMGNEIVVLIRKKNNILGSMFVISGFIIYIINWLMLYNGIKIFEGGGKNLLVSNFSPINIVAAELIFAGITMLEINFDFKITRKYSMYIYLFHFAVLNFLNFINNRLDIVSNPIVFIVITIFLTYLCSLLCSVVYINLLNIIRRRVFKYKC